jgi:hypothetical protein
MSLADEIASIEVEVARERAARERLSERLSQYVRVEPDSSCWLWSGALAGKAKRPCIKVAGRSVDVGRYLFERVHGPLGRLRLRSVCGVNNCVAPSHHQRIPVRRGARGNRRKDARGMLICPAGHRPLPVWADVEAIENTRCHRCRRILFGLRKKMLKIIHRGGHGVALHP